MVATIQEERTQSGEAQTRILMAASDAESTSQDVLERDAQELRASLSNSDASGFSVETISTLDRHQFVQKLAIFNPAVVVFSGRGTVQPYIRMQDYKGWVRQISGATLAKLFASADSNLSLLLLLNCSIYREKYYVSDFSQYLLTIQSKWRTHELPVDIGSKIFAKLKGRFEVSLAYMRLLDDLERTNTISGFQIEIIGSETIGIRTKKQLPSYSTWLEADPRLSEEFAPHRDSPVRGKLAAGANAVNKPVGPRTYRVWFGSNREYKIHGEVAHFSGDRGKNISYGYCDVSIPKFHQIGSIGESWWRRFPRFWQNNQLTTRTSVRLDEAVYFLQLQGLFKKLREDERVLLIFIHGFNVSFNEAAIRAAQLGFDLAVPGVTAFFSWASKGKMSLTSYTADEASIQASEKHISTFIEEMCERSGAKQAHIIAHSMGNRGLLRTFCSMTENVRKRVKGRLGQIILAAPDVDSDVFKDLASIYASSSKRTTMYVSSEDLALNSSGLLHRSPRAGYTPPVTVVGGIDTIEVSNVDLTFLGHGYVGEARAVLNDMHVLMASDSPPDKRFGLMAKKTSLNEDYWIIRT